MIPKDSHTLLAGDAPNSILIAYSPFQWDDGGPRAHGTEVPSTSYESPSQGQIDEMDVEQYPRENLGLIDSTPHRPSSSSSSSGDHNHHRPQIFDTTSHPVNAVSHSMPVSGDDIRSVLTPTASTTTLTPASTYSHLSPHDVFSDLQYPTDDLCTRTLLKQIINDFFEYLFPLIPVVHRPTFRASLDRNKDIYDKHFLSMLLALCAVTVGIFSDKFHEYRRALVPIRFCTRLEMIDYCYTLCMQLRGPRYFDEVSHAKWAIPYLFYLAHYHVGEHNKSRMIENEANQFARLLKLHRVSAYTGLNCIETQLRKKAFWLNFYAYVHSQLQDLRKERIAFMDCSLLHEIDLHDLLPVPQDDENITESSYGIPNGAHPTVTAGFVLRSRLFWAAVASLSRKPQMDHSGIQCHCTRLRDPEGYSKHLRARFHELKYMLDNAPWYLRQWSCKSENDETEAFLLGMDVKERHILETQLAVLRADIHTTHIWLQSIVMDQSDACSVVPTSLTAALPDTIRPVTRFDWSIREDVARQMLFLLSSLPQWSLAANGLHLVYKIRDVAVSLFACPFQESDESNDNIGPATRAKGYIQEFTSKLRHLDRSEKINSMNLQSWVDTDRNEAGQYYYW